MTMNIANIVRPIGYSGIGVEVGSTSTKELVAVAGERIGTQSSQRGAFVGSSSTGTIVSAEDRSR